jgi:hypothetical protein
LNLQSVVELEECRDVPKKELAKEYSTAKDVDKEEEKKAISSKNATSGS